jgi:hypothetical protein
LNEFIFEHGEYESAKDGAWKMVIKVCMCPAAVLLFAFKNHLKWKSYSNILENRKFSFYI